MMDSNLQKGGENVFRQSPTARLLHIDRQEKVPALGLLENNDCSGEKKVSLNKLAFGSSIMPQIGMPRSLKQNNSLY